MIASRQDFYASLVLIVFSAAVVIESLRMPMFEARGGTLATAPGLVPGALGIILALCGVIMLVRSVRGRTADLPEFAADEELEVDDENLVDEAPSAARRRLFIMLFLSIGYAAGLVGLVPFWLATSIFVSVAIALFEWKPQDAPGPRSRKLFFALLIGLITGLGITFIFEDIFLVRLP